MQFHSFPVNAVIETPEVPHAIAIKGNEEMHKNNAF